jgi:hypothetical protein
MRYPNGLGDPLPTAEIAIVTISHIAASDVEVKKTELRHVVSAHDNSLLTYLTPHRRLVSTRSRGIDRDSKVDDVPARRQYRGDILGRRRGADGTQAERPAMP